MSKKKATSKASADTQKKYGPPTLPKELEELFDRNAGGMRFPDYIINGTPKPVDQPLPSAAAGQGKAQPSPVVPPKKNVAENPNPSEKEAKPKKNTSVPSPKSPPKNVRSNKAKENIQSEKVDAAAVSTPKADTVETATNKVKNNNKITKENTGKKREENVKPKVDTKKKERHKPFRRGHDLDMDSKVRSEFFSMRLSGKELDNLSKKAAKCHMSTSTYARETLLSSIPRESLSEEEKDKMDKAYTMLEDANFNVRQMSNYFHSMLSEKDKDGKAKYDRLTWKELKEVIQKQKAVLDFLDNEFRI